MLNSRWKIPACRNWNPKKRQISSLRNPSAVEKCRKRVSECIGRISTHPMGLPLGRSSSTLPQISCFLTLPAASVTSTSRMPASPYATAVSGRCGMPGGMKMRPSISSTGDSASTTNTPMQMTISHVFTLHMRMADRPPLP